jgi:hypothetical protein
MCVLTHQNDHKWLYPRLDLPLYPHFGSRPGNGGFSLRGLNPNSLREHTVNLHQNDHNIVFPLIENIVKTWGNVSETQSCPCSKETDSEHIASSKTARHQVQEMQKKLQEKSMLCLMLAFQPSKALAFIS